VDHFREEEILTRPEFAAVAEKFGATGAVGPGTSVAATERFVESVLAHGDDVAIADALVPFVPTLPAPVRPVVVFLDGDAGAALSRAGEREGPEWLDQHVGKLAAYEVRPPVAERADELTPGEVLKAAGQGLKP
jgi:hypothetical protein